MKTVRHHHAPSRKRYAHLVHPPFFINSRLQQSFFYKTMESFLVEIDWLEVFMPTNIFTP